MATKATVKTFTFSVSVKVGNVWKSVAEYKTTKASIPAGVTAFNKWFDGWLIASNEYRIDGRDPDGKIVYQWSHIPELDT